MELGLPSLLPGLPLLSFAKNCFPELAGGWPAIEAPPSVFANVVKSFNVGIRQPVGTILASPVPLIAK